MKPIHITPKADRDIDDCFLWIQEDNPAAALRFLDAVQHCCEAISYMPAMGVRRYADISLIQGVRMLPVQGFTHHLLMYVEYEAYVDVVRLLHSSRDLPVILQS